MPKSGSSLSSSDTTDFAQKAAASHPQDPKATRLSVNYSFPCPGCRELIALPPQSRLGWAGTSQYLYTAVWPVLFLCNRYASIAEVPSSAVRLSTNLMIGQLHRMDSILIIEGDCCLENCGKRHEIYTHYPSDANQSSILQAFLRTNPYITCLGGHPAKFQRDRLAVNRLIMA